jgi:RpiR family carbohydrate utilization transcriptional regulator
MDKVQVLPSSTTDPLARIRALGRELPEAQQRVGDAILADPDWTVRAAAEEIARRAQVSPPTVVRFCRTLGYEGLSDFKLQLAQRLAVGTPYLHRAVTAKDDTARPHPQDPVRRGRGAHQPRAHTSIPRRSSRRWRRSRPRGASSASRSGWCRRSWRTTRNRASPGWASTPTRTSTPTCTHFRGGAVVAGRGARDLARPAALPALLESVQLAREQGATVIGITQPGYAARAALHDRALGVVPEDAAVRVGTEAYLAAQMIIEMLTVGVGLRLGPAAIERLKRVRACCSSVAWTATCIPALHRAWSENDRDAANE